MPKEDLQLLLSKGNAYKTLIKLDDGCITLTQNRWLIAGWLAVFGLMGLGMSPWLGGPILAVSLFYLLWFKQLKLDIQSRRIVGIAGITPFRKTYQGDFARIDSVTFREVVSTRTTDGNEAHGRWVNWDVALSAFDGAFQFSVWEEGDKVKVEKIALVLAERTGCELKTILPDHH